MLVHRFDPEVPLPVYGSAGAAAFDMHLSAIERPLARHVPDADKLPAGFEADPAPGARGWTIFPGALVHARSGLGFAIPRGHYLDIRSRSGWTGCGLVVVHGTIDEDYLGEVGAHIVNLSPRPIRVERGMRLFQAVLKRHERDTFEDVIGSAPGSDVVVAVRCGEAGQEPLFLRKADEGKPVMGDLVQLTRPADPQAPANQYDLHTIHKGPARRSRTNDVDHTGPARVTSDSYRARWDLVFGKAPKAQPN